MNTCFRKMSTIMLHNMIRQICLQRQFHNKSKVQTQLVRYIHFYHINSNFRIFFYLTFFHVYAAQKSTDDCLNVDASTASKSKPPTLDDYPDFTMTQITALDPILNATTTPNLRIRNKNVGKYDSSPYIRMSEGESSSNRVPTFFQIKHPFQNHNWFDVPVELIEEFNKWIFKDVKSRRGR